MPKSGGEGAWGTIAPKGSPGSAYIHCFSGKAVLATLYISLALGEVDP